MFILLRETHAAFVAYTGPVLAGAWFGFAACAAAVQSLQALTGLAPARAFWLFLAGALAGLLLQALAQGALAWLALRRDADVGPASASAAWRAAAAAWRGLLTGAFLRTALSFICALSVTPLLVSSGLVPVTLEPVEVSAGNLPRLAVARSLDAAALGVLHPFTAWVAPARLALRPAFLRTQLPDPDAWLNYAMKNHMDPSSRLIFQAYYVPMAALPAGLMALAGLAVLLAGEWLLRFYPAASIDPRACAALAGGGVFQPLQQSARLSLRHARVVLLNAVTLRLAVRALQALCLVLTASAAELAVLPQLADASGAAWVLPAGRLAAIAGSAAVGALLSAFCEIYDARLYRQLR